MSNAPALVSEVAVLTKRRSSPRGPRVARVARSRMGKRVPARRLSLHNGQRALRLEPNATSPNVIEGNAANSVPNGVFGATIGGGGAALGKNSVNDLYGTVAGGGENRAGNTNIVLNDASYATVGGGGLNTATNTGAVVGGGFDNGANGAYGTVAGGIGNHADGPYSFAAGRGAVADDVGAFVWADGQGPLLNSPAPNTLIARARTGSGSGRRRRPQTRFRPAASSTRARVGT